MIVQPGAKDTIGPPKSGNPAHSSSTTASALPKGNLAESWMGREHTYLAQGGS